MGLSLIFADSFAHYDQAGLAIGKWDVPGGTIETSGAHVRTGPQSLRITAGNAPSLTTRLQNSGYGYCTIGFAWQTSSLAGETIFHLIDSGSGDLQLYLVQNADGSLSLWSGTPDTLLATSAPGTITVGPFWYIEISVVLNIGFQTPQAILTVTSSPGGIANTVINFSPVPTSQGDFDTLAFIGPAGDAWLADVYVLGQWDGSGDPQAIIGAPKIYGLNVPVADGLDFVGFNTAGKITCFDGSVPPLYPQCNSIPQNEALYLTETDNNPGSPGWIVAAQAFGVDAVGVPAGSTIAAVQEVFLLEAGAGDNTNYTAPGGWVGYSGHAAPDYYSSGGNYLSIAPNTTVPYAFFLMPLLQNPVTLADWVLTDFGAGGLQFGVYLGQPG
jgi:hypothetical protein